MHLKKISLHPDKYPRKDCYPFNLDIFNNTSTVHFKSPVSFFVGENGTGKSTLLKAIARRCGIHIWDGIQRTRFNYNPHEDELYRFITLEWNDSAVPGSFFASEIFHNFAASLDEWAAVSPDTLNYFGGKSLMTQSHGQCHMSFYRSRFAITGLYLLDEPENALSPGRQVELLKLLREMGNAGHAQFIIATHSPILLALPGAEIFSFDFSELEIIEYEQTSHFRVYKDFMNNREKFIL